MPTKSRPEQCTNLLESITELSLLEFKTLIFSLLISFKLKQRDTKSVSQSKINSRYFYSKRNARSPLKSDNPNWRRQAKPARSPVQPTVERKIQLKAELLPVKPERHLIKLDPAWSKTKAALEFTPLTVGSTPIWRLPGAPPARAYIFPTRKPVERKKWYSVPKGTIPRPPRDGKKIFNLPPQPGSKRQIKLAQRRAEGKDVPTPEKSQPKVGDSSGRAGGIGLSAATRRRQRANVREKSEAFKEYSLKKLTSSDPLPKVEPETRTRANPRFKAFNFPSLGLKPRREELMALKEHMGKVRKVAESFNDVLYRVYGRHVNTSEIPEYRDVKPA
jgi:hypothetical protein